MIQDEQFEIEPIEYPKEWVLDEERLRQEIAEIFYVPFLEILADE